MAHHHQHHAAKPVAKRGLVARHCNRTSLFQPRARTWLYNHGPSLVAFGHNEWHSSLACRELAADIDYVPMVFDLTSLGALGGIRAYSEIAPHAHWLMGMNEPSEHNHNQTARAVAYRWSEMESLASRFALRLVSPAPGGLELRKASRWLRDFFELCKGCRIDAVAVHFYECDGRDEATAAASARAMMTFIDDVHRRHKLPVWLTEWNCGDGAAPQPYANQSAANHLRFMRHALPLLEAAPHVERYAWFQTWQRHTPRHPGNNPGCSLTNGDGSALSELGRFYNTFGQPRTMTLKRPVG